MGYLEKRDDAKARSYNPPLVGIYRAKLHIYTYSVQTWFVSVKQVSKTKIYHYFDQHPLLPSNPRFLCRSGPRLLFTVTNRSNQRSFGPPLHKNLEPDREIADVVKIMIYLSL